MSDPKSMGPEEFFRALMHSHFVALADAQRSSKDVFGVTDSFARINDVAQLLSALSNADAAEVARRCEKIVAAARAA